ncbi:uncharacterized protein PFB0145c-like isoform X2 [Rhopalosiphum maidis]|uniref:uncharacterized protein PFB0145c-like isoform X2 n=1 Tax=Rhopalosiphum maidis TaxID=43146 RepID=UPI000EFF9513|nr:uncharacterized protein PFB0145c-like isoform X2 [Rhopalosiphum maidis]
MNVDKCKNNFLTSHKSRSENADIQSKLNSWFEEKGIINKLRAQIREQMISALEDSTILNTNKRNVNSPKIQAINLLVADFLINQENLFTLSVFTTEVPLLANLHEFSSYINRLGDSTQKIPVTKPTFQLNDVQDILEALGIQPNTDITELTCQYYFNEKQVHSLLACLFKSITTIRNNLSKYNTVQINQNCNEINKSKNIENNTYEHRLNNWLVSIEDILCSFNLNEEQKNTLKMLLKKYHQNNNVQETAVYKEHLKKLERQNKEMVEKVADVEKILAAHFHFHDSKLMFQKEGIEHATQQLRLEQQQLYQLINVFEEKEKSIQEKLNKSEEEYNKNLQYIENQKYELRLKEMDILRHEKMLKRESLNYINETKISESNQVKQLHEQNIDLGKQLVEIKSKLNKLEGYKKDEQSCSKKIDFLSDQEMMKKLKKDNDELRDFIKVQQQRIEELSYKASNLAKQIEKTHQVPLTDYENRNVRKKLCFVDNSNKKNHYIAQNISSTTTDYSTTMLESDNLTEDDIIQEAESRLKTLEINTAKVEQNLKNFQINHSRHNLQFNVIRDTKKSYNEIRSNLSDDSDLDVLKRCSNKINLKELANKIGYHRSVRRSLNHSQSDNDTSSETLRNAKYQNYKNSTNISPIKILSSSIKKNVCKESFVNKQSSSIESPINKSNYNTQDSINISNISTQSPKENKLQIESDVKNTLLPDTNSDVQNNDNFDLQLFKHTEIINSPHKQISIQQDSSNGVDNLSNSKKLQESDHTISFGSSNKTDKSSDFWAL